ncbi:MAG: lantibiotic dehydratase [Actinomycetota bacterium]
MSLPPPPDDLAPSGFFVVRTPLLPFDTLTGLPGDRRSPGDRDWLAAVLARPEIREAIHLASPRVEAGIDRWLADPDADDSRRLEPVLVSYVLRAASRPTPFGLFAGWTTGTIGAAGSRTGLRLAELGRYRRHSRLDLDYVAELSDAVGRDRLLRRSLLHRPNSSLHESAGRLHLAVSRYRDGRRSHHLVAVEPTPYLRATLERAAGRAAGATLDELADALVGGDITAADARAYIDALVDQQLLVAELGPAVTASDPGLHLAGRLATTPATAPLARPLEEAHLALAALDEQAPGSSDGPPATRYAALSAVLGGLPGGAQRQGFVRVDLEKPAEEAVLGPEVVAAIGQGIDLLHRLSPRGDDPGLTRFREEFEARYGSRAVPLAEALDDEMGIGFERVESPAAEAPDLLGDIPFRSPDPGDRDGDGGERGTARDAALLRRLGAALWDRAAEIELTPADITELEGVNGDPPRPLPGALAAVARLAARSAADLAAGRFRVHLAFAGGPSGAELLGRLCASDKVLRAGVEAHLRAEEAQRPNAVFAEIVHLPEGRAGNVLVRPVLRRYEIPYLGQSGAPPDAQIPVSDLLVSVRDERIVLESAALGVEVLPRLTCAHLHTRPGLPVYRFLARLQYQDVAAELGWDWGGLAGAPFLPRVVAGRVVLALARWRLTGPDLAWLRAAAPERAEPLAAWRAKWRVPRFVALVDGEDELAIDLDSDLAVDALAHQLRHRSTATLVELFPAPEDLCVTGPEGSFLHDLVVPFLSRPAATAQPGDHPPLSAGAAPPARPARRRFPPGSEWLYAKLYTGPATADRVLLGTVAPLAAEARASGAADRWFFVRYADPEPHLRVRFGGPPDRLRTEIQPRLEEAAARLIDDGLVWRLQFDTYDREVERYGGAAAIELAEEVFAADTEAVVDILAGPVGRPVADLRWRAALAGVARLVADLGLTADEQRRLAAESCAGYGAELAVDGRFRQAVSRRFRRERALLEALITPGRRPDPALGPEWGAVAEALERRSARIGPVVGELRRLAAGGRLTATLEDLAADLAHMHVNRLLRAAPRAQELVIYEFLDRLWAGRAARSSADDPNHRR